MKYLKNFAVSFALSATSSVVCSFAVKEFKASKGTCTSAPDYLLILGCRVKGDEAQDTLLTRINAAADYLKQNENTTAICCGGIVHADQTKSEAQAIKEGLIENGIDESRIILEDESTTTEENFINAKKIIGTLSESEDVQIAFLSSEFHLLRAAEICKKAGLKATSVAAASPKKSRLKNYIREFIVFPAVYLK